MRERDAFFPELAPLRVVEYRVQPGDTLDGVARRHGVSPRFLQAKNGLHSEMLHPGQRLLIRQSVAQSDIVRQASPAALPRPCRRRNSASTARPSGQNGSRAARAATASSGDELAAHDLLGLEAERPVVDGAVRHAVHDGVLVDPAQREERLDGDVDAELLGGLAARAVVEGLAGGEHAADGDVPVPRDRRPWSARADGRRARRRG